MKSLKLVEKDAGRGKTKWSEKPGSLDEIEVTNLLQMLTPKERIHFVNEAARALKKGGRLTITVPHWCSSRALGDLAFQWPPVSEAWFHHLNAEWRKVNAPWGTTYKCDFDVSGGGYSVHPQIQSRNDEYQMHAVTFWKEAAQSLSTTLTKR